VAACLFLRPVPRDAPPRSEESLCWFSFASFPLTVEGDGLP